MRTREPAARPSNGVFARIGRGRRRLSRLSPDPVEHRDRARTGEPQRTAMSHEAARHRH